MDQLEFFRNELTFDHSYQGYPCRLVCVEGHREFSDHTSSFYGLVLKGDCQIKTAATNLTLTEQMYFALPGDFSLTTSGQVVIFQRWGYRTLPTFAGPLEDDGRLSYIDTCRSSILVHPARLGDPVLNLLVFSPNIEQSPHHHPTTRLGAVVSGSGTFVGSAQKPIEKGMVFALKSFETHCFHSGPNGLMVVAFHPDSDVGPTDEQHPMKSRTYLLK